MTAVVPYVAPIQSAIEGALNICINPQTTAKAVWTQSRIHRCVIGRVIERGASAAPLSAGGVSTTYLARYGLSSSTNHGSTEECTQHSP